MTEHPITPSPELVQRWAISSPIKYLDESWAYELFITHQAARRGAGQELEACVNYVDNTISGNKARALRAHRRPKPPSLKEQALIELGDVYNRNKIDDVTYDTIRLALEALPE